MGEPVVGEEKSDAKDGEKEQSGSKGGLKEELGSKEVEIEGNIVEEEDGNVTRHGKSESVKLVELGELKESKGEDWSLKGKIFSGKTTSLELRYWWLERSRSLYPFTLGGYPRKTQALDLGSNLVRWPAGVEA